MRNAILTSLPAVALLLAGCQAPTTTAAEAACEGGKCDAVSTSDVQRCTEKRTLASQGGPDDLVVQTYRAGLLVDELGQHDPTSKDHFWTAHYTFSYEGGRMTESRRDTGDYSRMRYDAAGLVRRIESGVSGKDFDDQPFDRLDVVVENDYDADGRFHVSRTDEYTGSERSTLAADGTWDTITTYSYVGPLLAKRESVDTLSPAGAGPLFLQTYDYDGDRLAGSHLTMSSTPDPWHYKIEHDAQGRRSVIELIKGDVLSDRATFSYDGTTVVATVVHHIDSPADAWTATYRGTFVSDDGHQDGEPLRLIVERAEDTQTIERDACFVTRESSTWTYGTLQNLIGR